jgi:hypothetical protein
VRGSHGYQAKNLTGLRYSPALRMTTPANLLGGTDTACVASSFALPFSVARPRAFGLLTVTSARVEHLRLPGAAGSSN